MRKIFAEIQQWTIEALRAPSPPSILHDEMFARNLQALLDYGASLAEHRESTRSTSTLSYADDGTVANHLRQGATKASRFSCPIGYVDRLPKSHSLDGAEQRAFVAALAKAKAVVNPLVHHSFDERGALRFDFWATYERRDLLEIRKLIPFALPAFVLDSELKSEADAARINWRLDADMMTAEASLKIAHEGEQYDGFVSLYNDTIHERDPEHFLGLAMRPAQKVHKGLSHFSWNFTKKLIVGGWLTPAPELIAPEHGILQFRRLSREEVVQGAPVAFQDDPRVIPTWAVATRAHPLALDTLTAWVNHVLQMLDYTHNYPRFAAMLNTALSERFPARADLMITKEAPQAEDGGFKPFSTEDLCHLLNNTAVVLGRSGAVAKSLQTFDLALRLSEPAVRHRIQYNLARVHKTQALSLAKACLELEPGFDKAARLLKG